MSLSSQQRLSTWLKHDILRVIDSRHSVILLLYSTCQPPLIRRAFNLYQFWNQDYSVGLVSVLSYILKAVCLCRRLQVFTSQSGSGYTTGFRPVAVTLFSMHISPIGMMTRSCMSPSGRNRRMIFTSLSLNFRSESKTLTLGCWIVKTRSRSIWVACFHLEVPCCTWNGLCCSCEWTDHAGASCKKSGDNLRYTLVLQLSYGTRV